MTDHRIRIMINPDRRRRPSGPRCAICDQPVQWVLSDDWNRNSERWNTGHWEHTPVDPDDLAASMRRHPAKGKP